MTKTSRTAAVLAAAIAAAAQAQADTQAPPSGVVMLAASATAEVTNDLLTLVLAASRDGADPAAVQSGLRQALDAALAEAKRVAKPGQIDIQTGNFSLFPRHDKNGRIAGWQGSTELRLEGRDMPGIGALAGRIATMQVARVGQGLSREAREKAEGELAAQAIARFRAKAADYARAFGYAGYTIREVNVSSADIAPPVPVMMARAKAMPAGADESLPVEAGKGTVTISVGGSVQMTMTKQP